MTFTVQFTGYKFTPFYLSYLPFPLLLLTNKRWLYKKVRENILKKQNEREKPNQRNEECDSMQETGVRAEQNAEDIEKGIKFQENHQYFIWEEKTCFFTHSHKENQHTFLVSICCAILCHPFIMPTIYFMLKTLTAYSLNALSMNENKNELLHTMCISIKIRVDCGNRYTCVMQTTFITITE